MLACNIIRVHYTDEVISVIYFLPSYGYRQSLARLLELLSKHVRMSIRCVNVLYTIPVHINAILFESYLFRILEGKLESYYNYCENSTRK